MSAEPNLRIVPVKTPIRIETVVEPVEMSQETQNNLWRVMLEGAQERGSGELPSVYFYRRRFAISPIWIPVSLGLIFVLLAIVKAIA
jgi:hypothetical protein